MRSALTKVDGVLLAEVSLPDKAIVTVDQAKVKNADLLIKAVKNAGYGAKEREKKEKKEVK